LIAPQAQPIIALAAGGKLESNRMRRALSRALVIGSTVLLGALIGLWLGRSQAVAVEESILTRDADRGMHLYTSYSREIVSFLQAMNASALTPCSDADLDHLRQMLFNSHLPKAAGRFRDGKIACAAGMGNQTLSAFRDQPNVVLASGLSIYWNFLGLNPDGQPATALRIGESFLLADPLGLDAVHATAPHTTFTLQDIRTQAVVNAVGRHISDVPQFTKTGLARTHAGLFSANCETNNHSCFIAYETYSEAFHAQHGLTIACAVAGGVLSAMLGFLAMLYYERNISLEQKLRRAIRIDDLGVVYQPIVEIGTSRIVGAEALVRWSDEKGNPISPEDFIPVAEEAGFIGDITSLVFRHALRDFKLFFTKHPHFRLSVNIAASDLVDPDFGAMLDATLSHHGVSAKNIALEVTERATVEKTLAEQGIQRLRRCGHRIYVDDFGTGYSSLSYLHELSLDAVKIDQSFTKSIGTDSVTKSILPFIVAAAQQLDLQVVVEGVETQEQAAYLSSFDYTICGQGWHYGRPCKAREFFELMDARI
jgi:sensor c-di-GMP phosphodiesterase-like protein